MTRALVLAALCGSLSIVGARGAAGQSPPSFDTAFPQAAPTPEVEAYRARVDAIVRTALEQGQAYEMLSELCSVAPHRLSGSPGAAAAVEWGRQKMLELGFENVRLEPCKVPHWVRGEVERLRLVEPAEAGGDELRVLALGGSVATPPEGISAEVIEVRDFQELEERADEARGRFVFFNRPVDPTRARTFEAYGGAVDQRSQGAVRAARVGAVGAIVRSIGTALDDAPHTGAMQYLDRVEKIPAVAVSTLGAEKLSALIDQGPVRLWMKLECKTLPDKDSFNVVGELVGTEKPDEIVVVGGHLDAWDVGHGAHDDGSGCVQSLEAVRLVRELGLRPRRTLRVVLFMNEENGLRGGRAYNAAHRDANHVMALESDRGGFTPRGFTSDAPPEAMAILQGIGSLLRPIGIERVVPGFGGVDIGPLREQGVPLVGYEPDSQRYFDLHHSENDTIDQVSPRELELGAAAIAAMIYVVADLEQPLPRSSDGGAQPQPGR